MNALPILFWLSLLLPGAAIARRLLPQELRGGILPCLAVWWMTTLVVLAPVVILAYIMRVPLSALSALVAAFIAWGAFDLIRGRVWRGTRTYVLAIIGVAGAVILLDVVLAERVGAIMNNDARVHIARIRFLLEHGMSNDDPFIQTPVRYLYPIYHTNLIHALQAVACKILSIDPLHMWFGSLGASRLMIASSAAYLAWVVLGGLWAPWAAALIAVIHRAPYDYTLYPNQLAPWFAAPIALAVVIRVLSATWREQGINVWCTLCLVGGVTAVVGMIHPLYAGFFVVIAAPFAGVVAVWRLVRRRTGMATAIVTVSVLVTVGGMFPLVSQLMSVPAGATGNVAPPSERAVTRRTRESAASQLVESELPVEQRADPKPGNADAEGNARASVISAQDGFSIWKVGDSRWIGRTFGRGFTGGLWGFPAWRLLVLAVGTFIAVRLVKRKEALLLAAAIGTIQAIVTIPPLCTEAIRFLGAHWMILRFETLAFVLWIPLSIPALAAALEFWRPWRLGATLVLSTAIALLALAIGWAHGSFVRPYSPQLWWDRAMAGSAAQRSGRLHGLVEQQSWMQGAIPEDAVVVCGRLTGTWVAMLRGSSLVCSERSSTGVPRGATRVLQTAEMLDDRTDEMRRALLFDHYQVTHVLYAGRAPEWVEYWALDTSCAHGHTVAELRNEPNPALTVQQEIANAGRDVLRGNAEGAHCQLLQLVQEHPEIPIAWYQLGNAEMSLMNPAAAQHAYEMAWSLDLEDVRFVLMRGNALQAQGRLDEAIAAFRESVALAAGKQDDGLAASSCFNLGNALTRAHRRAEAEVEFRRALEFDPEHQKAAEALKILGISPKAR